MCTWPLPLTEVFVPAEQEESRLLSARAARDGGQAWRANQGGETPDARWLYLRTASTQPERRPELYSVADGTSRGAAGNVSLGLGTGASTSRKGSCPFLQRRSFELDQADFTEPLHPPPSRRRSVSIQSHHPSCVLQEPADSAVTNGLFLFLRRPSKPLGRVGRRQRATEHGRVSGKPERTSQRPQRRPQSSARQENRNADHC